MARLDDRLPENAPGDWFVDSTCIDCDTCRWIAPEVFGREDDRGQSIVLRQPAAAEERRRAAMALVACPTSSIGTTRKDDIGAASAAFPERIDGDVFYCGYASEASFGASSYLLLRPQGNVLVDSPRAAKPLLRRIAELGGVRTMVLTHRDDVADHEIFHRELGCDRVMHAADVGGDTRGVEVQIDGRDPIAIGEGLTIVPVPGHTRGSVALLAHDRYLFSGDHLWASDDERHLDASRGVCWYSWAEQTRSMQRLLDHGFEWVLPGHGRRFRAASAAAMRAEVEALVRRMKAA